MFFYIFVILFSFNIHATTTFKGEHLQGRLVAPQSTIGPDGRVKLAVYYRMDPEWHIYWKNAGDSGAAPNFQITGGTLTSIEWPYPKRIPVGDLTNFGYEHETALLLNIKPDPNAKEIKLNLEWLVCKVECIPGFGEVTWSIPRGEKEIWKSDVDPDVVLYRKYEALIPKTTGDWSLKTLERTSTELKLQLSGDQIFNELEVFPADGETFLTKAPLINPVGKNQLEISVPLSVNAENKPGQTEFTFVGKNESRTQAFVLSTDLQPPATGLIMALIFAFLGGLILNLMPCVFPVLSLKFFGFLKEKDSNKIRSSAWAYTIGVLTTFTLVGAGLTILRFYGESVGWGYQLQNPTMIYLLAMLFFIMALNFWGFFEIGESASGWAGRLGQSRFLSGSFGTGVLAVVVASPCTAPFMGTALGLTLLLPWPQSLAIFLALGAGMAFPILIVGHIPKLATYLPRSGLWMENFKKAMAFPLLATALWLLWVLSHQRGTDVVFISLGSALGIIFGLWVGLISKKIFFKWLGLLLAFGFFIYSLQQIYLAEAPTAQKDQASSWKPYDAALLEQQVLTQPVFVDFTASWCITCQVNKKAVLDTTEIQDFFKKNNVLLMRADWTNQDPIITKALAALGRNSVPVYAFYGKPGKPQLLPQLLTKNMIFDLFKQTGETK